MTPTLWFWSDHPRAGRARKFFLTATGVFFLLALYLLVTTAYIDSLADKDVNLGPLLNQILAFFAAGLILSMILRKAFDEVASAYGQVGKIVNHMSDYFHVVDKDWNYTFVNRKLAKLLRREPDELIGQSVWNFVPPSFQSELREKYTEAMRTGRPLRLEVYTPETDVWSDIQAYPDAEGLAVFFQDITERKRSEQSFRAVVDTAMDGVIAIDADQNILLFNHAAENMFQVKAEDALGKPVTTLMPGRFRDSHTDHVDAYGKTSTTMRRMGALGEVYGLRADGSEFPIEVSISKTAGHGARIYTAIIRDVTEKRTALRRLDQKIKQQVALAQFSMNSLTDTDRGDLAIAAAQLAREHLDADYCTIADVDQPQGRVALVATDGWSPSSDITYELANMPTNGLIHRLLRTHGIIRFDDTAQEPGLSEDKIMRELGVRSGLGLGVQTTGGHVWMIFVLSKNTLSFSPDDAEFVQTLANIVARTQQSVSVLRTLRLRDRALEAITQGITITDETTSDRPIIYTNPAYARMTGYPVKDILGSSPAHYLAADAPAGVMDHFALIRAKRRSGSLDTRTRKRDGSSFVDHVTVSPILGEDGDLLHYVTVHEDVTEARQRESQLHESQKMEVVGQLTGGVAHDFNNLLTVVRANAEDMRNDLKHDPILLEQIDMVLQATERGAKLIRQMMAFARKQDLDPERVDINVMLQTFVKLARRTLQENITIDVRCQPDVPLIHVDPGRLETAILNLVLNARDAMPEGGTITIESSIAKLDRSYTRHNADARPGTYVMLAVTDSGVGMNKEVASKAFDPFFTTKEVGHGTGLGLSMVYGFLRQSGGHAKIYSEVGIGTTVKVYLPIAAGETKAASPEASHPPAPAAKASGSILVVEDDDLVRQSVSGRLARMGYTVSTAENADAAIAALEENPAFDLVFSDVIMPGTMTGADLAREIKRRWPQVNILLTSGYTAVSALHKIQMPPDIPLLSKPYSMEQLREALSGMIRKT